MGCLESSWLLPTPAWEINPVGVRRPVNVFLSSSGDFGRLGTIMCVSLLKLILTVDVGWESREQGEPGGKRDIV